MYRIGLTGGIASGKSVVADILADLGAYIIDADKIARLVVAPFKPAWQDILASFGDKIILPTQAIDREKLGDMVFRDQALRQKLDNIMHPRIKEEVLLEIQNVTQKKCRIVVLDIPLLIEVKWFDIVDVVWLVYVDEASQLIRLMQRNGYTFHQAQERIKAQMNLDEKLAYADVVIDNNGDIAETKKQVIAQWAKTIADVG